MARVAINTGASANDGTGDNLRSAGGILNNNFLELYTYLGAGSTTVLSAPLWSSTNAGINTLRNVGIGTTNPRFILEVGAVGASGTTLFVNGDARVTGIVTIGPASITLNGITNTVNVGTGITLNGSTGIISATAIVLGGTTLTGAAVTFITAGSGISVDQGTGNVTITATGGGGSSQFVTTAAGIHTLSNVGIGTTNPTSALTVTGNGTFTGVVTATTFIGALTGTATTAINAQGLTGTPNITVGVATASTLNVGTGGTIITTTTAGLVGIGTTNPTSKLTVSGNVNIVGVATATSFSGSGSGLTNIPSGQLSGALPAIDGSALIGVVGSGSGVIIKDDGSSVGTAGTIDFGENLSVSFSSGIATITATGGGGSSQFVTTAAGIHTLSNVGIGTTNPTSALTVTGNGTFTGVVTATTFIGALTGTATTATNIPNLIGAITSNNTTTSLGSFSSSNLFTALTDKTGTGVAVFATSPTLVTPSLGIATASSLIVGSGVTINTSGIIASAGIITAPSFVGALTGTATTATGLSGTPNITVGIVTTSSLRGYSALVGTASSTTTTFIVNVASKTTNHRYYGTGSGSAYFIDGIESPFLTLLPGKTYRFNQEDASNSSHPVRFYYDAAKTTQYTTNVTTSGTPGNAGAYTEIVVTDTTPVVLHYQCSNHGYMGNATHFSSNVVDTPYQITTRSGLSVSGISTLTSNVSVGGTISVDGAVKLITNNGTIVGTSGSTGEIKRIAGAPFFYDGSAWREFVLSTGTPVAVPADTEWNNVILRSTYNTDAPGFFDFKFSQHPILTGVGATTVSSPVKIGTKSFRNNGAIGAGISYAYRSEHDFTGPWTIEFWIYHDDFPYNSNSYAESMVSQISLSDTSNNWSFGVQYDGSNVVWYWFNEAIAVEKQLKSVSSAVFTSDFIDKWKHYALVRESINGSLHFYIDGYEVDITTDNSVIDNDITSTNGAGLHIGGAFVDTINSEGINSVSSIDAFFDDLRITTEERYVSVGNTTTLVVGIATTTTALPTTGTLSSYVQPPGDKYGEIGLGGSPTWRGTSGVTVSQQSSGNYRVSFASTYTNSNDYFVLSHAMDQGFASYVGIARSTTHVDFSINKESDNAVVNTGSLSVQIKNHL